MTTGNEQVLACKPTQSGSGYDSRTCWSPERFFYPPGPNKGVGPPFRFLFSLPEGADPTNKCLTRELFVWGKGCHAHAGK